MVHDGWVHQCVHACVFFSSSIPFFFSNLIFFSGPINTFLLDDLLLCFCGSKCRALCCLAREHIFCVCAVDYGEGKKNERGSFFVAFETHYREVFVRFFLNRRLRMKKEKRNRRNKKKRATEYVTFDPGSCQTLVPSPHRVACCIRFP